MTEAMYAQIRAAEEQMRRAEQRASKLKDVRADLSGLTGVGQAAEGRVQAEWTARGGLAGLELDPRAMKMASQDLAAAITEAVNAASKDLAEKSRQILLDSGVVDPDGAAPDPDRAQKFIAEQRERMETIIRPAADTIAEATAKRSTLR